MGMDNVQEVRQVLPINFILDLFGLDALEVRQALIKDSCGSQHSGLGTASVPIRESVGYPALRRRE